MFENNMINMIRERRCPKGLVAVVLAAMALVVASCSQDRIGDGVLQRDNVIRFTVSGGTAIQLKSGNDVADGTRYLEPLTLTNEDGTQSLTFQRRSYLTPDSETLDRLCAAGAVTKGTPVTGYNIDSLYGDNLFVTALKGDGSEYIPQQNLVFVSREEGKSESTWTTASPYYWPGEDLIFWGWAPNGDMADLAVTKTALSFTYTTPDSDGAGTDAEAQSDLIVANTAANLKSGSAKLMFAHALSAIRFEIGKTNDCTIKSISLKGVQSVGECTYTPAAEGTKVVWSNTDVAEDYTQVFGDNVHEYLIDDDNTQSIGTQAKTFMVIPQTSDESNTITLEVVYRLAGSTEDVTLSKELDEETSGWEAGYTYTYALSVLNGLDIELDDDVSEDGKTKDNLTTQNVGGEPAYVRVLVTGYWVNKDGDIVAVWDPSDETMGVFSPKIFAATPVLNENWVKGADGFYYYTKVLPAGAVTETKLFDSYVVNEAGKPKNLKISDHLEIDIVTQAVVVDAGKAAITTAWGATAAGYVEEMPTE